MPASCTGAAQNGSCFIGASSAWQQHAACSRLPVAAARLQATMHLVKVRDQLHSCTLDMLLRASRRTVTLLQPPLCAALPATACGIVSYLPVATRYTATPTATMHNRSVLHCRTVCMWQRQQQPPHLPQRLPVQGTQQRLVARTGVVVLAAQQAMPAAIAVQWQLSGTSTCRWWMPRITHASPTCSGCLAWPLRTMADHQQQRCVAMQATFDIFLMSCQSTRWRWPPQHWNSSGPPFSCDGTCLAPQADAKLAPTGCF